MGVEQGPPRIQDWTGDKVICRASRSDQGNKMGDHNVKMSELDMDVARRLAVARSEVSVSSGNTVVSQPSTPPRCSIGRVQE